MRYLILIALLLSGCSTKPHFAMGDCFKDKPDPKKERWEEQSHFVYEVKELGKAKYRLKVRSLDSDYTVERSQPYDWDRFEEKTPCPVEIYETH